MPYLLEMAALTVVLAAGAAVNCGILGDIAADDFKFLWWWIPFHVLYGVVLIFATGFGYFSAWLPQGLVAWLEAMLAHGLDFYLVLMAFAQVGKLMCLLVQKLTVKKKSL